MRFKSIRDVIGRTPLVRLRFDSFPGVRVYAKLEMQNLFGMKDRVALNVITQAKRTGALSDAAPIVESSSGTMALGVALVGRSLGHPVHIVTDPRIDRVTMAKLRALGCVVHVVLEMSGQGWQGARLERLEALLRDLPGAFWPQQYSNPDNPGAYGALAEELLTDLGHVDVLVGSVGSGGSLCGSSRVLRESIPGVRVVGVDCVGSALFGQPDVPQRLQSGLGNSLRPANLDRRLIDEVHWLNDHEAFAATRALAAEQQIFAGNTAGSVYRVLSDLVARARPGDRIVGIFPDRGDRYTDTVYSDEHWAEHELSSMASSPSAATVGYGTVVHTWSKSLTNDLVHDQPHLLFIESNTTGTGMLALRMARRLGVRAVLMTSAPARYPGLGEMECEVLVCDTNSRSALRTAVHQRFRREEITGVTTTSDFYVPAVAELNEWLGLPGNTAEATRTCRNKAELRTALAGAGAHQPRFAVVPDPADVAAAVARVGLPCVVKPVDDSGSNDVLLCSTREAAVEHAARTLATRVNVRGMATAGLVLVEEYLDQPEFSVEMFSWRGEPVWAGITAKSVTGLPYFVESRHVFPAVIEPAVADELLRTARRAVAATGVRTGPTHTEIKLTPSGPAIVEINPRLAGGMIPELIRYATGIDLLEQQLRAATGSSPEFTPNSAGYAGIQFLLAPAAGTLHAIDGVARAERIPGVERVTVTAIAGSEVRVPRNAYDRLGYVIARHDRPGGVEPVLDRAAAELDIVIEASPVPVR
nr:pyridoxal-phosphate dependent enzyme [Kibdelosporangium sp. MJ126-NF4]CEL13329.1 Cysteine synthase [Kibdelosporangium sp. MJ126-NF4]CTQ99020.1 Cysteine synthase (EC 2.5.1.47) [Kibdelosporangium sp. MJ126-NF4]